MERDLSRSIIKTEKLKAFLARRRWQRCGQAIRALRRLKGGTLSNSSSTESLILSADASPATSNAASPLASPSTSQVSSPVLARKTLALAADTSAMITATAKLNLLEEKLKQEFTGSSRIVTWVLSIHSFTMAVKFVLCRKGSEQEKIFKSQVENEQSVSGEESKDSRWTTFNECQVNTEQDLLMWYVKDGTVQSQNVKPCTSQVSSDKACVDI